MSSGIGLRRGSDPILLWLWCRPVAAAPIRPIAWEIHMSQVQPLKAKNAAGVALEKTKNKNKKTNKKNK